MTTPRYQHIAQGLVEQIETGTLKPGEKLPSLRDMRLRTGVSLGTVLTAYAELESRGIIEARPRSGYYVRQGFRQPAAPYSMPPPAAPRSRPVTRAALIKDVLSALGRHDLLPLGVSVVAPELLPARQLTRLLTQVMRENGDHALNYEPVQGHAELRRQIAFRSMDAGLDLSPDDLLITNGTVESLHLALKCVTRPDDTVLMQSPTYYCLIEMLEALGLRVVEVPSTPGDGVHPADVARALKVCSPAAAVLTPNFNNPDGSLTPEEVRPEVAALLHGAEVPIIEDDIYGDLHFGATRPSSFAAHGDPGMTLTCASFSKTLAPGFRVGWLAAGKWRDKAQALKVTTNVATASPMQRTVAEYLRRGLYDRHLKRLRTAVARQAETMRLAVGRHPLAL